MKQENIGTVGGLFLAVLLFSFGNYALGKLWEPIVAGLGGEGLSFPEGVWMFLLAGLITYGLLAAIGTTWVAKLTSNQCNTCKRSPSKWRQE